MHQAIQRKRPTLKHQQGKELGVGEDAEEGRRTTLSIYAPPPPIFIDAILKATKDERDTESTQNAPKETELT